MAMTMMKQMMARKAEKALKEILDKADSNFNGKVELNDFTQILEANGVEVGSKHILARNPRLAEVLRGDKLKNKKPNFSRLKLRFIRINIVLMSKTALVFSLATLSFLKI